VIQLVTPELRIEAERLLQLNDHGLRVERLAMALGIGAESERAMAELRKLDMEFLDGFRERPARIGTTNPPITTQPGEIPPA